MIRFKKIIQCNSNKKKHFTTEFINKKNNFLETSVNSKIDYIISSHLVLATLKFILQF